MADARTLDQAILLTSQVSKTARCAESVQEGESKTAQQAPGVKLMNRDLIASSENLNDLSPKSTHLAQSSNNQYSAVAQQISSP